MSPSAKWRLNYKLNASDRRFCCAVSKLMKISIMIQRYPLNLSPIVCILNARQNLLIVLEGKANCRWLLTATDDARTLSIVNIIRQLLSSFRHEIKQILISEKSFSSDFLAPHSLVPRVNSSQNRKLRASIAYLMSVLIISERAQQLFN